MWEKKHYVAKNQLGTENREPVTVVQDGVSNPVYTELKIGGDNQDENSSQKSIPEDVDDFAEVSANVEAIAVTLNDEAEGNKNNQDFFESFRDHDFGRLRKPIFTDLVKCLVQQGPENFQHKKDSFVKKKEDLFLSIGLNGERLEGVCGENGCYIHHANKQCFALSVLYFQDVNQVFVTKMDLAAGES